MDDYKSNFGTQVGTNRIRIAGIKFTNATTAEVGVDVFYQFMPRSGTKPMNLQSYVKESWLKTDGHWWHIMAH